MNTFFYYVLFALTFQWSLVAFADNAEENYKRLKPVHSHSGHTSKAILALVDDNSKQDPDAIAQSLVDQIHELEHDHSAQKSVKNFLAGWFRQLNLVKSVRELRRWVDLQTYQNPNVKDHVANLGVLFTASHIIEMTLGPSLAGVGHSMHWPEALNAAFLLGGAIISIPGLDPICIVLAGAYKTSSGFRAKLTGLRTTVSRWSCAVSSKVNLQDWFSYFGHWQSGRSRVEKLSAPVDKGLSYVLAGGRLFFQQDEKAIWLNSIEIENLTDFLTAWSVQKQYFDNNTRDAVEQSIHWANNSKKNALPFYVDYLMSTAESEHTGSFQVLLKNGAVQPRGRWLFCNHLLK